MVENWTEPMLYPYPSDVSPLRAASVADVDVEADHLKPEFRSRLASVGGGYRFVAGLRAVLKEHGFAKCRPGLHCGCPDCIRRCPSCSERLYGEE